MLKFTYKGKNSRGEVVEGTIECINKDTAIQILRKQNIQPISVGAEMKQSNPLEQFGFEFDLPNVDELILFSRQMYSLTKAGVPIVRSIKVVADSVYNKKLKAALEDIVHRLESGQTLASCMKRYQNIFPTIMYALVNVGENTGNLDEVFIQISTHLQRESDTKKKIKSAMRYPIMVLVTIAVAIGIINVFVVPAFANFFTQFGSELPLPTIILITTSNITLQYWHYIILALIAIGVAIRFYIKTPKGRLTWDRWKIKIPVVGSIVERALLARFARSFALTSRTGVPLIDSIVIIAKTTDNVYVSEKIIAMRKQIEHGESLTVSAKATSMFSTLVLQMMAIGEETGEIDRLLDEVADFYEQELEYDLKKLSESIEPILISIVATMVLILALGVFLPMWDISKVALG